MPTALRTVALVCLLSLSLVLPLAGCSDDAGGDTGGDGAQADTHSDALSDVVPGDSTGDTGLLDTGVGDNMDDGANDTTIAVCANISCAADQHCEGVGGAPTCVNNDCASLSCTATEECVTTAGGGAQCVDNACASDADCPAERWCDSLACVDDACTQGTSWCAVNTVKACADNGSVAFDVHTCGSAAGFVSSCKALSSTAAGCTCQDDWDCPADTRCELGICVTDGGAAASCVLEPLPFRSDKLVAEIIWGGVDRANRNAAGSPWPPSAQVTVSPLVINLDDDNNDGLVDERDVPEIIFVTYAGSVYTVDGVLRAIHGGGKRADGTSKKGQDYLAVCGDTTWHEGDAVPGGGCTNANLDASASPAAGDLDGDGFPEIVAILEDGRLRIYDNKGDIIATSSAHANYPNGAVAIANVDVDGLPELVFGGTVFTLELDAGGALAFVDQFQPGANVGRNGQGPLNCVADIAGDHGLEIIGGTTAYRLPVPPANVTRIADCAAGSTDNFCRGLLDVVWDAAAVPGNNVPVADGFCAIADVMGAASGSAPGPSNPLDGEPDVVLITNGWLQILDGNTGTQLHVEDLNVVDRGGAPNVDDFDGDGFPEIGTAADIAYIMIDLQEPSAACPAWTGVLVDGQAPPAGNAARTPNGAPCTSDADCAAGEAVCNTQRGECVCLHNGWRRRTEDDSSRVTGSTLFDFNGDGATEVVYNDECFFRAYDGLNGDVLFKENVVSRTRIEYPVVADVDNDGNAEIIFGTNNDTTSCSAGNNFNNGIEVWGDESDTWVSARRIWNQHAYHITNVFESGGIPVDQPKNWMPFNGRFYNSYRSNPRSTADIIAPDLTAASLQVTSPGGGCAAITTEVDLIVEVGNIGDFRGGSGLAVHFEGTWTAAAITEPLLDVAGQLLEITLPANLEPGQTTFLTVHYVAASNPQGTLPDSVTATVDPLGLERECDETNNATVGTVNLGAPQADLVVEMGVVDGTACPTPTVDVTVTNNGAVDVSDVLVRFYAGDPDQGGSMVYEQLFPGPIAASGGSVTVSVTLLGFPGFGKVTTYAVVDPDMQVAECNDGNNKAAASNAVECIVF